MSGRNAVPSLVDAEGHFFATVETRAQIQRALRSGVRIDCVHYHVGTITRCPGFREIAERSLVALVGRLHQRYKLVVTHVGGR